MKSIILAAGEGKRLRPLTKDIPKCMVRLFGKSLLEWQICTIKKCGITDISVVTGYKSDSIKIPDVKYYKNEEYFSTNMVETLFCAREELQGSIIVSYGDILYEENVLKQLINAKDDVAVIIDTNWEKYWRIRFDDPLDDAETMILDADRYVLDLGQKPDRIEEIHGQYIGLMKFQDSGIKFMRQFYDNVRKIADSTGKNPLNASIEFKKSYMTDFLRGMINEGCKIRAIPINNGWVEIDTVTDHQTYTKMHHKNTLNQFFSLDK